MQSGQPVLAKIEKPDPIDFTPVITRNSFKDFLFPQTETVMIYTIKKNGVDVQPAGMEYPEMVVIRLPTLRCGWLGCHDTGV